MEVMTFANNATVGGMGSSTQKVSSCEKKEEDEGSYGEDQDGYLNGFVRSDQCRKCGGTGHWANECPKGKGKGGDMNAKGGQKGKGKGKGPKEGCWNCGGDHYQSACPSAPSASAWTTKGGGKKGSGKGFKGSGKGYKGKGGGLNQIHDAWPGPGYDNPWAEWHEGASYLSCLRTVPLVKIHNNYKDLEKNDEENEEEQIITKETTMKDDIKKRTQTPIIGQLIRDVSQANENHPKEIHQQCRKMPGVTKWKKAEGIKIEKVKPIVTIEPESLNAISDDGEWEEIEMAVDSGATETVGNEEMLGSIPTEPGPASKRGVEYEIADGTRIPNEGEKKFEAVTGEGQHKKLVIQVCGVNQGLLSVSKATAAHNRVVFDEEGSYILNKENGEVTWLTEKKGMYMLKLWVRRQTF